MKTDNATQQRAERVWLTQDSCRLDDFAAMCARQTQLADYNFARDVQANVLIYAGDAVRAALAVPGSRRALLAEWAEAFLSGPGIIVLEGMFSDHGVIDATSEIFAALIAEEKAAHTGGGDHFAKPGANDRVWNALEKLCLRHPAMFAAYYSNPILAAVSEAWLGPAYQVTSQVNVVNPGGAAQSAHRDYHLGFQAASDAARFPAQAHRLSPALTLQGAVAHCDMPLETGPTLYLPYSQTYAPGYLAFARPDFAAYFAAHHVQLPLRKGDGVFFNPALFHAAGHNRSGTVRRMANLLQVSSAFGRAMESVDRERISAALFPALLAARAEGRMTAEEIACAIAACAEGYSFPTNLDRDPPLGGLVPQTQAALMTQALAQGWPPARFAEALAALAEKRLT